MEPTHRIALSFADETASDGALWRAWLATLDERLRGAAEMGERRPLFSVFAPFPSRNALQASRGDALAGLVLVRSLVAAVELLANERRRPVCVRFSGQVVGCVRPTDGVDDALAGWLAQWRTLIDAQPADGPIWERDEYVSVWAGKMAADELDRMMCESYGTDRPISRFAKALGIFFYDHDSLECCRESVVAPLRVAIKRLSFAASFEELISEAQRPILVDTVVGLFGADFSTTRPDAGRLKFVGAFPFASGSVSGRSSGPTGRRAGR